MRRRANALSDAVIKTARPIDLTGIPTHLIGDWPMSGGRHALVVAVPADALIEIGDPS